MMRFEEFVVESWEGFDVFGNDYYFYGCELNPSFWAGREQDLEEINNHRKIFNEKPIVYFSFDDTGFLIQIYFPGNALEDENSPAWSYQGIISRGPKQD